MSQVFIAKKFYFNIWQLVIIQLQIIIKGDENISTKNSILGIFWFIYGMLIKNKMI